MTEILGIGLGPFVVLILRLLVPLTIFKWPLWGGLASGIMDTLDVVFVSLVGIGDFKHYAEVDKALDWYFLLFMAIVSLKWESLAKYPSLILFGYRTIGVMIFEITQVRVVLVIFPNLFLYWWYFVAIRNKFFPQFKLTVKRVIAILLILLVPKMIQELILHYWQWHPWNFITTNILN